MRSKIVPLDPRVHYTLNIPSSFRNKLNDASAKSGVPGTTIVQRLVTAWIDGRIKISDLAPLPK